MRVLILSSSTGGGHNAAAAAVTEALQAAGHDAEMMDMFLLSGPRTARLVIKHCSGRCTNLIINGFLCSHAGCVNYFFISAVFCIYAVNIAVAVFRIVRKSYCRGLSRFLRAKLCRKYGRYKPFMMAYGVPITILTCIITFVPTTLEYSTKIVVLHFLFTLRTRFTALYCDKPTSIVGLISPNMVERQKYYSIGGIFLGFFRSIFRIVFPVIISATGGYFAIKSYRVFIPIFSVASMLLGLSFAKVKERVAVNEDTGHKVDFKKSAKTLLSNKYFWLVNLSSTFELWNELGNGVLNFIIIYQMRYESILGLLSIFGVTSVIGNVLTPLLVKRYEKRTCILLMRSVWLITTLFYFVALKFSSVPMFLVIMFIRSAITAACNNITKNMSADVLDYHQWKTGERADNMQDIFQWFTTPIATALGLVSPWLFAKFGYTSDWDVLYDSTIFNHIMVVYIALNVVGLVLSTIPYLFYDLTRAKHDECVAEIARREQGIKDTSEAEA